MNRRVFIGSLVSSQALQLHRTQAMALQFPIAGDIWERTWDGCRAYVLFAGAGDVQYTSLGTIKSCDYNEWRERASNPECRYVGIKRIVEGPR